MRFDVTAASLASTLLALFLCGISSSVEALSADAAKTRRATTTTTTSSSSTATTILRSEGDDNNHHQQPQERSRRGSMRDRLQLKVIGRDMSVVFFPTAAHLETTDNDNDDESASSKTNPTWIVPIHGWIYDSTRPGLRRKAFLSLLRSAFDRKQKEPTGSSSESSDANNKEATATATATATDDDAEKERTVEEEEEQALLLAAAAAASKKADKAKVQQLLLRRLNPFLVNNHRRRKITIQFNKTTTTDSTDSKDAVMTRELPDRSHKNGHFHAALRFTEQELQQVLVPTNSSVGSDGGTAMIKFQAVTGRKKDSRRFQGTCHVLSPPTSAGAATNQEQVSIISDIDDTIKDTHVLDMNRLIRHTFLEEFKAVPGMPELYTAWKERYHGNNIFFHYVSSSPWQLYPEIAHFLERAGFPVAATFCLKSIRLKDRTLLNLFADPVSSKIHRISTLLETYPTRKFCLVGDTGERDPEVYGELCRKFPQQIHGVFLRDVTSQLSAETIDKLNRKQLKKAKKANAVPILIDAPDRCQRAFEHVPDDKWRLFTNPSELLNASLLPPNDNNSGEGDEEDDDDENSNDNK